MEEQSGSLEGMVGEELGVRSLELGVWSLELNNKRQMTNDK
jgi:hypothetical protein